MVIGIGIDIGSVSIKAAVAGTSAHRDHIDALKNLHGFTVPDIPGSGSSMLIALSPYRRIRGRPRDMVAELIEMIRGAVGDVPMRFAVTGSGAKLASTQFGLPAVNEFIAVAAAINLLHPDTRTVFEMGGESSKYLLFDRDPSAGTLTIRDYATNGDCAAGTGAFMDQQSSRLRFTIEDVGGVVARAEKAAQIAGRCSVFAKSDMIHAQQRGYTPDEVLKGLCNAVARNFKSAICRGKTVTPPVLFTGGVSVNSGVVTALREVFALDEHDLTVPETGRWLSAVGAALAAIDTHDGVAVDTQHANAAELAFPRTEPLSLDNVLLLRERVIPYEFPKTSEKVPAYLGIDIGSVSTNLVVTDAEGRVITEIYERTQARPIEVVRDGLRRISREIGKKIDIRGVGTTGSGRELIGILMGADTIKDEITAHKTGALHISRTMLGHDVDTIFEIGGQDSKYISIEDGVVVDFTMNDACAAGTGSFLEEQAEELDVNIIGEFAKLALSSHQPVRMGERCTVFMGRDVMSYLQRGAPREDVIAGLAYSVVQNYLNRVVRERRVGGHIFFQGGTAYNDAVAAAFAKVTGKTIIVPPHNGVMGAIGAALLAKRRIERTGAATTFKGFDLEKIDYHLREFTCKGCSNYCTIQEFTVDGEKTYWGDKCSERYRKRKAIDRQPLVEDLSATRDRFLTRAFEEDGKPGPVVGIPLAMYAYDRLPFYDTYLSECGFSLVHSDMTNRTIADKGIEEVIAEPCYPVTVAHGHVRELLDRGVEFVWLPNIVSAETEMPEYESHVCVWGATLPFVISHAAGFCAERHRFLTPTIHFREGRRTVKRELAAYFNRFGITREQSDRAVDRAYEEQEAFRRSLLNEGVRALEAVRKADGKAIILLGRPYNMYDRSINLSVAAKLATVYGITVIPMDFLGLAGVDISSHHGNMFWNYGRRILQACKIAAEDPRFDVIYLTNFKCGPDSFIKQYVRDILGRPFLVLQFDGHSNDAGMMTRCEAYLDSKGFLSE